MTKTATIDLRALAAAFHAVSTEETRYYLNGVYLEISRRAVRYVSTGGHKMIVAYHKLHKDEPDNTLTGSVIVPSAACKPFKLSASAIKYGSLEYTRVKLSGESLQGPLTFSQDKSSIGFVPVDGTFPDWRRVLPRAPNASEKPEPLASLKTIGFNWTYVEALTKAGRAIGHTAHPVLVPNGGGPAYAKWAQPVNDIELVGVIMPVRTFEADLSAPKWVGGYGFANEADTAPEVSTEAKQAA